MLHVALGVILDARGNILITRRAMTARHGGLWEFPGGKIERGESAKQALARELYEEVGITVSSTRPLLDFYHTQALRLRVWWIDDFTGKACGREGQPMRWIDVAEFTNYDFPPASKPIISAVRIELGTCTK